MFNFIEEGLFQETKIGIEKRFTYWEHGTPEPEVCEHPKKLLYIDLVGFKYDEMWLDPNDFLEYRKKIIIEVKIGWERKGFQSEFISKIPINEK